MRDRYKRQVALLIRILPSVYGIKEFAIHGGTAINLFHKDMPRYSVDIAITYISIEYSDYTQVRNYLTHWVNENLDDKGKEFLLSFESGTPDWSKCSSGDLSAYPSVQWKLLNIEKLKKSNPKKHEEGIVKLKAHLKI